MNSYILFNLYESVFWVFCGALCYFLAKKLSNKYRNLLISGFYTFVLFGLSDLVEIKVSGFLYPTVWWLLTWKVLCVVVIVLMIFWYLSLRIKQDSSDSIQPVNIESGERKSKLSKYLLVVLGVLIITVSVIVFLFSYLGGPITTKSDLARMQDDINKFGVPRMYINDEYGFELIYPQDWRVVGIKNENFIYLKKEFYSNAGGPEDNSGVCQLFIYPENMKFEDFKVWLKDKGYGYPDEGNYKIYDYVFASKDGIKQVNSESGFVRGIYVPLSNTKTLALSFSCGADVEKQGRNEIDKILSTFKFTKW